MRLNELAQNLTSVGQPLIPNPLPVDPDSPKNLKWLSADNKEWMLVFSDEFEKEGRTFGPGEDKNWEAVDLWYWPTRDLEWYDPHHAVTRGGRLEITLEKNESHAGLPYTSSMLQSWNKRCFQGGYLEVKVSLPGDGKKSGFWPAVWTLGNLGRAGYGATTEGLWPYTYNSCDDGVLLNQTNSALSQQPGQRLNACVCSGDHPSPGVGRGAPEIDIFEGSVNVDAGVITLSMSDQVAPFDYHYAIKKSEYTHIWNELHQPAADAPNQSRYNSYIGGTYQQSVSSLHYVDPATSTQGNFQVFGFEYRPGPKGYVRWFADGKPVWHLDARAVGPNKLSKVAQRLISEEPMYMIMNLGISSGFAYVDPTLPEKAKMYIDYIRLYQDPDNIRLSCDPEDRPTGEYIQNHPRAYYNANLTRWKDTGYGLPSYKLSNKCSPKVPNPFDKGDYLPMPSS
ncbi:family 16 glycoside hydrolase [Martensiomyces pterosporus]|nr:family 16 glycoside hydrolase [Martensiomyces pterosporus]